ncbi:MAG: DEAD/DEAH box helicase [Novosphingobium sp.]|nr:DEAD/DEAH box helicase [Novosphingobium sp.]
MKKIIITGETGSGKTYKVINEICKGEKFIYIAPCRQLVYESFIEYSNENDTLSTGEVHINGNGSLYAVYESISIENDYKEFNSIIIDEAHFISDSDRGGHLSEIIKKFKDKKNIYLVTATDSIDRRHFKDFESIHLISKFKVPKKKEVSGEMFWENIEKGKKTIIFCNSISDSFSLSEALKNNGYKSLAINSTISPSERLKNQYDFMKGDIQVVCATNVLAQGLNFPAENIYIPKDMWDTEEMIVQKLGRLGRPFLSDSEEVHYCIEYAEIPKKLKKKKPAKKEKRSSYCRFNIFGEKKIIIKDEKNFIKIEGGYIVDSSFPNHELCDPEDMKTWDYDSCYSSIKYSKKFIEFLYSFLEKDEFYFHILFSNYKEPENSYYDLKPHKHDFIFIDDFVEKIHYAKKSILHNEKEIKDLIINLKTRRKHEYKQVV